MEKLNNWAKYMKWMGSAEGYGHFIFCILKVELFNQYVQLQGVREKRQGCGGCVS